MIEIARNRVKVGHAARELATVFSVTLFLFSVIDLLVKVVG